MEHRRHLYNFLSASITIIFIAPFIYITRFAYLSADDFCRANAEFGDYWSYIIEWYLNQNGRFTNAFLSFLPVYNTYIYRLVLAFSTLLLGIALLFLVKNVFKHFNLVERWSEVFFISVLFYLAIIICLPSPFEFFYWYAGTSAYMYSIIFFLFLTGLLLRKNENSNKYYFFSGLLIVLINGNNEMLIPLINFLLLVLLMKTLIFDKNKLNYKILLLNILSWISSLVVIFSPGSTNRQGFYPEGGDVLFSIKSAILSSGMFILKKTLEFPSLFLYLGLILFFLHFKIKAQTKQLTFNPFYLAVFSFIGLSSVFFVPYYATGHLNVNQGRIGNMIHVIFWVMLFINMVNITLYSKRFFSKKTFGSVYLPMGIIVVFCFIVGFSNTNFQGLVSDFKNDEFKRFGREMDRRENEIKQAKGPRLELQKISGTEIMKYYGISTNEDNWTNRCYTSTINFFFNKEFDQIVID